MHTCAWILAAASFLDFPTTEPSVVPALISALRDPDIETRIYAGTALATLGPKSVESLISALQDEDRNARAGAAYALGQLGAVAGPAKPRLIAALKDDDKDVRRQAAFALSRVLASENERPIMSPSPPAPVFPAEPPR